MRLPLRGRRAAQRRPRRRRSAGVSGASTRDRVVGAGNAGGRVQAPPPAPASRRKPRSRARASAASRSAGWTNGVIRNSDRQPVPRIDVLAVARSCAASGSDEPKCALTLRPRFAAPGETLQQPAVVEELPLRLHRVEARPPRCARGANAVAGVPSRCALRHRVAEGPLDQREHDQRVRWRQGDRRPSRRGRSSSAASSRRDRRRLQDVEQADRRERERDPQASSPTK